jgi:hypothetical protein
MSSSLRLSSLSAIGLTLVVTFILLAASFTVINAQQPGQQLTSQPSAIENGVAATPTFQSTNDSFSLRVPQGWVIHDLNNTGFAFSEETRQGYGMLAQLCPEEGQQQQGATALSTNTSGSTNNNSGSNRISTSSNSCQGSQDGVIHIIRYPNLQTRIQPGNNVTIYHLEKLQEVGYRDIQTVNSTSMIVNVTDPETNQTITTVPAKFVEITYSTNFTPNEIRRGYFILTATNWTAPDVGTTKGYSMFYEGNSSNSATAAAPGITTTSASSSLRSLPPAVGQIFDSFEFIVAPEVAQAFSGQAAEGESLLLTNTTDTNATEITEPTETAEVGGDDDSGGDDDNNGGDDDDNNNNGGDDDDNGGDDDDNNNNGGDDDDNGGDDDDNNNNGGDDDDNNGGDDDDNNNNGGDDDDNNNNGGDDDDEDGSGN